MWETVTNMIPTANRMMSARGRDRDRGISITTAMIIGAGVGIAAWEMMRRNNSMGQAAKNMTQGNNGNNTDLSQMATEVMDAIR
ncbi:hypothetical protein [Effusibacillus dendaii]|uniref:Uncharacterized protein n=1 Tax=Effusibacillus dendaii TaxID=2743772 RepID=A0A7I8DAK2_9BACL|nr:hypothetical protein [Effusibacillus dendaii]BCJ87017.1 hypothetical protein skT53_20020 [Effusibacillus dendaii]